MRRLKLLIFVCILSFIASCGQQKKYLSYKIKEGETMRTVAKRLDMKTKDLLRLNPDVGRKPDVNTVIIIPNKKKNVISTTEKVTQKTKDTIIITDKKKDSISSIEDVKRKFVIHQVKKGETIYRLQKFYNVSKKELLTLNPILIDGLKTGQLIKIKPIEDKKENEIYKDIVKRTSSINVAMLLPFKTKMLDTLSAKKAFQRIKKNKLANIVTDFYMGAEIAIDSLKKQGISINLEMYDTGKKQSKIKEIITQNDFSNTDVFIGPLYSEEVNSIANKLNAPVVFPHYSKKQSYFSSSKIIKTAPEKKIYLKELLSYITKAYQGENIVVVGDDKWQSNLAITKSVEILKKHDSINHVAVLKPEKGYLSKDRLLKVLKPNVYNWIIITCNNNVITSDVVNSLISLPKDRKAKLFSVEKGTSFHTIDDNKLAQIGFTFVTDSYIDEDAFTTKTFNAQFKRKNFVLPSKYATRGFDVTYDILMRLASGDDLKETFKKGTSYRVESKYDYSKKLSNTSDNNGLFITQYNLDLSFTRLK